MLHTHTQHTPREREVPRGRKFAEKLNALVKSAHAFSPSPLLLLFSLGAQMSMRIASLSFSCRLPLSPPRWTPGPSNLNYGRFKRNNFNICSKSWNYRGCWHQTCPLLAFSVVSVHRSFYGTVKPAPLVLLVTTSDVVDWVVCAPAAFLRSMKHISCSFSGVEPKSSVTRHYHRSPLYYG